jgi:hypothetical protein
LPVQVSRRPSCLKITWDEAASKRNMFCGVVPRVNKFDVGNGVSETFPPIKRFKGPRCVCNNSRIITDIFASGGHRRVPIRDGSETRDHSDCDSHWNRD